MLFRPMKSATPVQLSQIRFPQLASAKLDGLRCVLTQGAARTISYKPFRNAFVQQELAQLANSDIDGEIIVGPPNKGVVLGRTQSGVMTTSGEPDFRLYAFDRFSFVTERFEKRNASLLQEKHTRLVVLEQRLVSNLDELSAFELEVLADGYEGAMLRDPNSHYKFGRASPGENAMWKLKRFTDGEAIVMSFDEGTTNNNPVEFDAFGLTDRGTKKEFMIGSRQVGTLKCIDLETKENEDISPGRLTKAQRIHFFQNPEKLIGKIIKYKSFDYGKLNTSRFRTFQTFRHPDDL